MLITLALTQSRGSYLAIVIVLVALLSIRWRWTLLIVAIMSIATIAVWRQDGLVLFASAIGSDGSVTSLSGRWEIWVGSFYALLDYPLWGIPFGLSVRSCLGYSQPGIFKSSGVTHAHNLLLQVGLDLGVPGLLLYLWTWIMAIVIQVRLLRPIMKTNSQKSFQIRPVINDIGFDRKNESQLRRNSGNWPIDSHHRYVSPRHGRRCNLGYKTSVCTLPVTRHHRSALHQD